MLLVSVIISLVSVALTAVALKKARKLEQKIEVIELKTRKLK